MGERERATMVWILFKYLFDYSVLFNGQRADLDFLFFYTERVMRQPVFNSFEWRGNADNGLMDGNAG